METVKDEEQIFWNEEENFLHRSIEKNVKFNSNEVLQGLLSLTNTKANKISQQLGSLNAAGEALTKFVNDRRAIEGVEKQINDILPFYNELLKTVNTNLEKPEDKLDAKEWKKQYKDSKRQIEEAKKILKQSLDRFDKLIDEILLKNVE